MAKYAKAGWEVVVLTVAGHRPPLYAESVYEQTVREAKAAHGIVGVARSEFLDIPATLVSQVKTHELNGMIVSAVKRVAPSMVLIPYPDRHVDHRIIFDSAMVATRPVGFGTSIRTLAAYETLSETHWNAPHIEPMFAPNWVNDISAHLELKLKALECFASQIPPFPGARSLEAIKALAAFRGTQAGFAYGEAFQIIRMVT